MILQAASTAGGWPDALLDQGPVGILAMLCIIAVVAMWRHAATISKRVETVTDRFLGHLEAQAKRDAIEAETRVAAQLKVADALDAVERRMNEHDGQAERRHREVMDTLRGH